MPSLHNYCLRSLRNLRQVLKGLSPSIGVVCQPWRSCLPWPRLVSAEAEAGAGTGPVTLAPSLLETGSFPSPARAWKQFFVCV